MGKRTANARFEVSCLNTFPWLAKFKLSRLITSLLNGAVGKNTSVFPCLTQIEINFNPSAENEFKSFKIKNPLIFDRFANKLCLFTEWKSNRESFKKTVEIYFSRDIPSNT